MGCTVRLILASRSPRRAMLLREAGYVFEQMDPPLEDPAHPESVHADPREVAMSVARAKALSFAHCDALSGGARDAVVLAADTLIVHDDGSLAGTPQSPAEARAMLRRFVGVRHEVVSGIALWRAGLAEPVTDVDVAGVSVGAVSEGQIEQYLAGGDWRGKAGGYNLFERQAAGWPIVVEGEPSTVVGLPMPVLTRRLREWGVEPGR